MKELKIKGFLIILIVFIVLCSFSFSKATDGIESDEGKSAVNDTDKAIGNIITGAYKIFTAFDLATDVNSPLGIAIKFNN